MTVRDDVLEILALLEAEGVRVSIDAGGVVVEGATSAMSDRARAALATLEGRSAQLRRVMAEGAAPGAAPCRPVPPEGVAGATVGTCFYGHPKNAANTYHRPRAGHGSDCVLCRRRRVKAAKAKRRTAAAKPTPEPTPEPKVKKRPGPPRQPMCARGLHLLDEENAYLTPDGRRRCRTCVRVREKRKCRACARREKRNHPPAPMPAPLEATE
jgi:hypothetical protein